VTALYRQLGIPERGRVACFDGPHKIGRSEAFPSLDNVTVWNSNPREHGRQPGDIGSVRVDGLIRLVQGVRRNMGRIDVGAANAIY
jgi:hypothetical protein